MYSLIIRLSYLNLYLEVFNMADYGTINLGPNRGYTAPIDAATLAGQIGSIISNIMGFLTVVAGLGFLFYFLIGAVNWLVSTGDQQKITTARNQMLNAIIGLVITVAAWPVIYIIGKLLGIPIDNPADLINQIAFP